MNAEELTALNDQIAGMARAGLPLDQGLAGLARDMSRGKLRRVTEAIAADLRQGATLPEAMEKQKGELPSYYANLITAGVKTGRLPEVLATMTGYARTVSTMRSIIIDSLFYPAIILLISLAILGAVVYYLMPQFDKIFQEFGMRLPLLTQFVLALSRHPVQYLLIPLGILFLLPLMVWLVLRSTTHGRLQTAAFVYRLPVIGQLLRSARLAAFADLLAMLVEYQVPLPEALKLAGEASSDPIMAHQAQTIHDRVASGMPLPEALRGRGLLPEWVAWMTGAGAERGGLSAMLRQIAELYRRQAESRAALFRTVFPSIVIILTAGLLVAGFSGAIMLPLVKLLEGLSK